MWCIVAEKKTSLGKDWHALCLKCTKCNKVLSPGQHAEVLNFYTIVASIRRQYWGEVDTPQASSTSGNGEAVFPCPADYGVCMEERCKLPRGFRTEPRPKINLVHFSVTAYFRWNDGAESKRRF